MRWFFCDAGISVPPGLPSFEWFAAQLNSLLNMTPSSIGKEMIRERKIPEALDTLERQNGHDDFPRF